jgi:hypothetical protein
MPQALAQAWKHLQIESKASAKEIVIATDGQKHGWADIATLAAFDNLGEQWRSNIERAKNDGKAVPSIRIVRFGGELPESLPNYSLAPLTASRRVGKVGQSVRFQSALLLNGFTAYQRPSIRLEVNGKPVQKIEVPEKVDLKSGQIPLAFTHRFDRAGRHVGKLIVDAEDALPGDNAQQVVIEVVQELPILLVDGDRKLSPESSSFFLHRTLPEARALPYPAMQIMPGDSASLIVLADVPRLTPTQQEAIDRHLAAGGGLLVVLGERVAKEQAFYNDQLYRKGNGWLPARLGDVRFAKDGVQPEPRSFQHPALELFRTTKDSMAQVRFTNWWHMDIAAKDRAVVIATLSNGDPFMIEKPYKKGRVILCTAPLDRRWNSTLPSTPEFPILANELAFYLAGSRVIEGDAQTPDLRESDLTRCTEEDWRKVRSRLPVIWQDDSGLNGSLDDAAGTRDELWWLLLIGVIGLLCVEVWMTRRMALAR